MIASDWGDWLPRAVETAVPSGVSLWYLGCNGFFVKAADGTTILIDPYLGTGDPPRTIRMVPVPFNPRDVSELTAMLATHEHTDHVHGPSQAPILENTGAEWYGPPASREVTSEEAWTTDWNVNESQVHTVEPGDSFGIGSLTVHVEATHDPDAIDPVGYVIEHAAGTIFHGGDTKPHDSLTEIGEGYDIDIGILAFGSEGMILDKETREPTYTSWYADETGIITAANALELDRLVPTHWDMWKGLTADPTALHDHARSFPAPSRVDIVEIGDRIDLP